jgi:hypothetical protein
MRNTADVTGGEPSPSDCSPSQVCVLSLDVVKSDLDTIQPVWYIHYQAETYPW